MPTDQVACNSPLWSRNPRRRWQPKPSAGFGCNDCRASPRDSNYCPPSSFPIYPWICLQMSRMMFIFKYESGKFHWLLTCTSIHNAAIADYQTVTIAGVAQLKVGVLNLNHGADQILLELVGCKGRRNRRWKRYSLDSRRLRTIRTNRIRNTMASKFESKGI